MILGTQIYEKIYENPTKRLGKFIFIRTFALSVIANGVSFIGFGIPFINEIIRLICVCSTTYKHEKYNTIVFSPIMK